MALVPFRSPGVDDRDIAFLLSEIRRSQTTLDEAMEEARALPLSDLTRSARLKRYNALKRQVDKVYREATLAVKGWAEVAIPDVYIRGQILTSLQLRSDLGFDVLHREAIDELSRDAFDDVGTGLQQIPQEFADRVNAQFSIEQLSHSRRDLIAIGARRGISQQLILGEESPAAVARALSEELWANDIDIIDRAGRQWNPESYTRMLVRTKSANAFNVGTLNKLNQEKVARVEVFDGVQDDPECAEANGQVWTLKYAYDHVIAHPNCRRAFAPKIGGGRLHRATADEVAKYAGKRLGIIVLEQFALREFRRWQALGKIDLLPPELRSLTVRFEPLAPIRDEADRLSDLINRRVNGGLQAVDIERIAPQRYTRVATRVAREARAASRVVLALPDTGEVSDAFNPQRFRRTADEIKNALDDPPTALLERQTFPNLELFRNDPGLKFNENQIELLDDLIDLMSNNPREVLTTTGELVDYLATVFASHPERTGHVADLIFDLKMASRWATGHDTADYVGMLKAIFKGRVTRVISEGINGTKLVIDDLVFVKIDSGGTSWWQVSAEVITNWVARALGIPTRNIPIQWIDEHSSAMHYMSGWDSAEYYSGGLTELIQDRAKSREMSLWSIITNMQDQHGGNFLFNPTDRLGQIIPIDHEFAYQKWPNPSFGSAYHVNDRLLRGRIDDYVLSDRFAYDLDEVLEPWVPGSTLRHKKFWKYQKARDDIGVPIEYHEDSGKAVLPVGMGWNPERRAASWRVVDTRTNTKDTVTRLFREDTDTHEEIVQELTSDVAKSIDDPTSLHEFISSVDDVVLGVRRRLRKAVDWGMIDLFDEHRFTDFATIGDIAEGDDVRFTLRFPAGHFDSLGRQFEEDIVDGVVYATLRDPVTNERRILVVHGLNKDRMIHDDAERWRLLAIKESDIEGAVGTTVPTQAVRERLDGLDLGALLRPYDGDDTSGFTFTRRTDDGELVEEVGAVEVRFGRDYAAPDARATASGRFLDRPSPDVMDVVEPELKARVEEAIRDELSKIHPRFRPKAVDLRQVVVNDTRLRGIYNPEGILRTLNVPADDFTRQGGVAIDSGNDFARLFDRLAIADRQDGPTAAIEYFRTRGGLDNIIDDIRHTVRHEAAHRMADTIHTANVERAREQLIDLAMVDDEVLERLIFKEGFLPKRLDEVSVRSVDEFRRLPEEEARALIAREVDTQVTTEFTEFLRRREEQVSAFWSETHTDQLRLVPGNFHYPLTGWWANRVNPGPSLHHLEFEAEVLRSIVDRDQRALRWVGDKLQKLRPPTDDEFVNAFADALHLDDRPLTQWFEGGPRGGRLAMSRPANMTPERYQRIADFRVEIPGSILDEDVLTRVYGNDFGRFSVIPRIQKHQRGATISGSLVSDTGDHIGDFRRSIRVADDGTITVSHDSLFLNDEWQGQGIGTEFFEWTEDWYVAKGVDRIEVSTASVGGYNWARRGYDFVHPEDELRRLLEPQGIMGILQLIKQRAAPTAVESFEEAQEIVRKIIGMRKTAASILLTDEVRAMADAEGLSLNRFNDAVLHDRPTKNIREILEDFDLEPDLFEWKPLRPSTDTVNAMKAIQEGMAVDDEVVNAFAHGLIPWHPDDQRMFARWFEDIANEFSTVNEFQLRQASRGIDSAFNKGLVQTAGDPYVQLISNAFQRVGFQVAMRSVVRDLLNRGWTAFDVSQIGSEYAIRNPVANRLMWLGKELMLGRGWLGVKQLSRFKPGAQAVITPKVIKSLEDARGVVVQGDGTVRILLKRPPRPEVRDLERWVTGPIEQYTFEDYQVINQALRGEQPLTASTYRLIRRIDEDLANGPSLDDARRVYNSDVVYRGSGQPLDYWERLVGQTFTTESYMSSTFGTEVNEFVSERENYVIAIQLRDGTKARYIHGGQDEVVFPRRSRFYVKSIEDGHLPGFMEGSGRDVKIVVLEDMAQTAEHVRDLRPNSVYHDVTFEDMLKISEDSEFDYVVGRATMNDGRVFEGGFRLSRRRNQPVEVFGMDFLDDTEEFVPLENFFDPSDVARWELATAFDQQSSSLIPASISIPERPPAKILDEIQQLLGETVDDTGRRRWYGVEVEFESDPGVRTRRVIVDLDGDAFVDEDANRLFAPEWRVRRIVDRIDGSAPEEIADELAEGTNAVGAGVLNMFGETHTVPKTTLRNFLRYYSQLHLDDSGETIARQFAAQQSLNPIVRAQFTELGRRLDDFVQLGLFNANDTDGFTNQILRFHVDAGGDGVIDPAAGDAIFGHLNEADFRTVIFEAAEAVIEESSHGIIDVRYWVFDRAMANEYDLMLSDIEYLWETYLDDTGYPDDWAVTALGFLDEVLRVVSPGSKVSRNISAPDDIDDAPIGFLFSEYFSLANEIDGGETLATLDDDAIFYAARAARDLDLPWPPDLLEAENFLLDNPDIMGKGL